MRFYRRVGFEILESRRLLAVDVGCIAGGDTVMANNFLDSLYDYGVATAASSGDNTSASDDSSYSAADAGSTKGTAKYVGVLEGEQSFYGSVGRWDTADILRFTLTNSAEVNLVLKRLRADVDMAVYGSGGQRIAVANRSGRTVETISLNLAAGDYYVAIVPWRLSYSTYILTTEVAYREPTPPDSDTSTPVGDDPADDREPTDSSGTNTDTSGPESDGSSGGAVNAFPEVDYYGDSNDWNLNSMNAPESWAQGYSGEGVVVAVIDTGVALNHNDLDEQIWVNMDEIVGNGIDDDLNGYVDDVYGWDFVDGDGTPDDENGHGTHVAGTIAAEENGMGATGVAPNATIMAVRALDENGYGTEYTVAAGIRYAVQNGASIINLSLGGTFSRLIQSAILFAQQQDVLVVVASGNESASTPSYPAAFSATINNVLSVGSYNSSEALAYFSNDVGYSNAVQVDAPGVSVYSTYLNNGYAVLSGTSMAAPHTAGLAALALSADYSLTASDLRAMIVQGADQNISASDSAGGINAALTVALAAAGQDAGSASTTSTVTNTTTVVSQSRYRPTRGFQPRSTTVDSLTPLLSFDWAPRATSSMSEVANRSINTLPPAEQIAVSKNLSDQALLAMMDEWETV